MQRLTFALAEFNIQRGGDIPLGRKSKAELAAEKKKQEIREKKAEWQRDNMTAVNFTVTKLQRELIEKKAKEAGLSISAYSRRVMLDAVGWDNAKDRKQRRGFILEGTKYYTIEELQAALKERGIEVTDNVILNLITKGRLSKENREKYPILLELEPFYYKF